MQHGEIAPNTLADMLKDLKSIDGSSDMRYAYPSNIVRDEEERITTGRVAYGVTFPDVPEANTCGHSWEEAIEMAEDGLGVALGMYVKAGEDLPTPSRVRDGQVLVPVPLLVAAKLTLYTAMRQQGITNDALASRLSLGVDAVQKLVSPRYRSHISQLERALRVVGRALVVEDCDAVPNTGREQELMAQVNS